MHERRLGEIHFERHLLHPPWVCGVSASLDVGIAEETDSRWISREWPVRERVDLNDLDGRHSIS